MDALSFRHVSKHYGRQQVLADVCLDVPRGAVLALVGENGAGKTTLLKCLLDFCALDGGEMTVFGRNHAEPAARQALAYLPERFLPPAWLTGDEFLRYVLQLHGLPYDRTEALRLLQSLELEEPALLRTVRQYSKGMTQKLGLAATFLIRKDLYVLDEPTSGLDPKARALFKRQLRELNGAGATVLMTTHALADVEEVCSHMAILHQGTLRFTGTPADCLAQYGGGSLEAAFLQCVQ